MPSVQYQSHTYQHPNLTIDGDDGDSSSETGNVGPHIVEVGQENQL